MAISKGRELLKKKLECQAPEDEGFYVPGQRAEIPLKFNGKDIGFAIQEEHSQNRMKDGVKGD